MPQLTKSAAESLNRKPTLTIEQILSESNPNCNKPKTLARKEPHEAVYSIRHSTFRYAPRSTLLPSSPATSPLLILPEDQPPLLVDGKMQIVAIPKWRRRVSFYWRTSDGDKTQVILRSVKLPRRVWVGRNLERKGRFEELFVERC